MIVVDVETGGIDPHKNPLFSIGAVDFDNPENTFYGPCKAYGHCEVTQEALDINGIDPKKWNKESPNLKDVMDTFVEWLKTTKDPSILAGHNPRFDLDFLNVNAERCGIKLPFSYRTVDLHTLAYADRLRKYPSADEKMTSEYIYKYLGIPVEPRPHNALTGAKYETRAFSALLWGD